MGLTVGVLGTDHPHAGGHFATLEAAPEIERLLIWDENETRGRTCAEGLTKGQFVADWDAVLADSAIPFIVMLEKDRLAGPRTVEAIEAGKWVYGDKPGAHTAKEMSEVVAAAERTGCHFCPAYLNRINPVAREIATLLHDGGIGRMWSFNCQWITSQVALRGPQNWLFHKAHSAGGILTWLGSHWLDLLRVFLGCEVAAVTAMTATQCEEDIDVEDTAAVVLRFANGAVGVVRAGYALRLYSGYDDSDMHFQFEGSDGALTWYPRREKGYRLRSVNPRYAPCGTARDIVIEGGTKSTRPGYGGDFLVTFMQAVRGECAPPCTERDAFEVLRIIEAAYQSAADGQQVVLR